MILHVAAKVCTLHTKDVIDFSVNFSYFLYTLQFELDKHELDVQIGPLLKLTVTITIIHIL